MTDRGEIAEWSATRAMRDERERRDGRDGRRFEVRSSRFPELRTPNFELRVALFPPVSPVSLESGIRDCSRCVHESCGQEPAGKCACLRSFLQIDLYKSTRRERLNLYRSVLTPDAWPIWTLNNDATATHENTVTARHPSVSRLGRRHLARGPHGAGFLQYIGTKGAHDVTVLL